MSNHASTMLTAIESVLEGRITSDIENYSIAGRQITKIPITELLVLRDRYKSEVQSEEEAARIAMGKNSRNKILTRH